MLAADDNQSSRLYAFAEDMLKKGIIEYNLQFGRNFEVTEELFVKNLREQEEKVY